MGTDMPDEHFVGISSTRLPGVCLERPGDDDDDDLDAAGSCPFLLHCDITDKV